MVDHLILSGLNNGGKKNMLSKKNNNKISYLYNLKSFAREKSKIIGESSINNNSNPLKVLSQARNAGQIAILMTIR